MDGNIVGLVAGISVVATVLLIVIITAVIIWCRNRQKKKRKDRSRQYIVHDGISPFSSVHGHSSGGVPSYNGVPQAWSSSSYFMPMGYENKGVDIGEFRQNPIADNPYYSRPRPMNAGIGMSNRDYDVDGHRYHSPQSSYSTQSLNYEGQSFHLSLYEKLGDTIHEHKGRPLYLCKREDFNYRLSQYFDVIGKSRTGDFLVRAHDSVPNRPKKKSINKKHRAPKPGSVLSEPRSNYDPVSSNGFIIKPGASGMITTPFGAAERVPTHYLSGSNINRIDESEHRFTSLPRDGKPRDYGRDGHMVRRQVSMGAADRLQNQKRIEEQQYAQVIKKHNLNGGTGQAPNLPDRQNPNRRPISVIEESPKSTSKAAPKGTDNHLGVPHRERSGSSSTVKSLGITDQFKFLEQYDTEEERF